MIYQEVLQMITPEGYLSICGIKLDKQVLKYIAMNNNIKHLQLSDCGINDEDFIFFMQNNKNVTILDVSGNKITDDSMPYVSKHPAIVSLDLSDQTPGLTNGACSHLGKYNFESITLKTLSLSNNLIGDSGCLYLSRNTRLKELYLAGNSITDVGVDCFSLNKSIETLSLSNNEVTSWGVRNFPVNNTITDLNMCLTKITDGGATAISQMKALKNLNLSFTRISEAGAMMLQALPKGEIVEIDGTISNPTMLFSQKFLKLQGKPQKLPGYMSRDNPGM